jgi:hypothetical protein
MKSGTVGARKETTGERQEAPIRNGIGAVRPFVYGRLDLLNFVKQVFGGVEVKESTTDSCGSADW